jgi:PAS domain S-box-containing protein
VVTNKQKKFIVKEFTAPEGQNLFRVIADTAPVMIWMADSGSVCNYLNSALREFIGQEFSQEIGNAWLERVHPQHKESFQHSYLRAFSARVPFKREYCMRHADGEYRWILDSAAPSFKEDGSFSGYVGYAVDITDKKDSYIKLQNINTCLREEIAQQKLAETERKEFFQLSLEMFCVLGFDSYFKHLNPAWKETLGWTEKELKALPLIDFIHPDDREKTLAEGKKLLTGSDTILFENRFRCKDGSYKWFSWKSTTLPQQQLIYSVARDITENKRAEQSLQRSYSLLYSVIDNIPDFIFAKDKEGRFALVNSSFSRFIGKPIGEIIGKQDSDCFAPETVRGYHNLDRKIIDTGIAETVEEFLVQDGIKRASLTTKTPWRDREGQIRGVIGISRDITERKRAEIALKKSEARNSAMLNAIPDYIFRINKDGIYLDFRASQESQLAVPPNEIIGKSAWDILPKEVAEKSHYYTNKALTTNNIQIFEYQLLINSELHDYEARLVPSGEDEVLAILRDITERKSSEAALAENEAKFRSIVENANDIIFSITPEGFFSYVSPNLVNFTGYEVSEWQGKSFKDFVHPDDVKLCSDLVSKMLMTGERQSSAPYKVKHKDGSFRWHTSNVSVVKDINGKFLYIVGIARDITESKQSQQALKKSERQYKELAAKETLLNQISSQIRASLDINTILETAVVEIHKLLKIDRCNFIWYRQNLHISYWEVVQEAKSPEISNQVGLQISTTQIGFISRKALNREIVRIDDVEKMPESPERSILLSFETRAILTLPIHTPGGEIGGINCSHYCEARPWDDSEVELLQAVANQIEIAVYQAELYNKSRIAAQTAEEKAEQLEKTLNELQQTQAQLIHAEKMSSLGQLVAGIAHEINNPVNFIHGNVNHANNYAKDLLGLVELYKRYYPQPVSEIQEEIEAIDFDFVKIDLPKLLASMKMGTERIRGIVLSLRNFSRLDEAEMKKVDIHEGIDSTLLLLQGRLKFKPGQPSIEIIKQYGDVPLVECYPGQLNQVFMNILANAIDALEEVFETSSTSTERQINNSPQIRITTENQGEQVLIRISDNGLGMTEEVSKRLFDPFFTTKPVGKGTGMGLSISYQIIVEKHYGKLECISAPGKGAEFLLSIPLHQES